MAEPPALPPCTDIVREYLEAQIKWNKVELLHLRELIDTKLIAMEAKQDKFEAVVSVKMLQLNEIRPQLAAQKAEFITRNEYDINHKLLDIKIDHVDDKKVVSQDMFDAKIAEVCKEMSTLNRFMWTVFGILAAVEFILRFLTT